MRQDVDDCREGTGSAEGEGNHGRPGAGAVRAATAELLDDDRAAGPERHDRYEQARDHDRKIAHDDDEPRGHAIRHGDAERDGDHQDDTLTSLETERAPSGARYSRASKLNASGYDTMILPVPGCSGFSSTQHSCGTS